MCVTDFGFLPTYFFKKQKNNLRALCSIFNTSWTSVIYIFFIIFTLQLAYPWPRLFSDCFHWLTEKTEMKFFDEKSNRKCVTRNKESLYQKIWKRKKVGNFSRNPLLSTPKEEAIRMNLVKQQISDKNRRKKEH